MPRARGGSHDPRNLTTICWGHHAALHDGRLTVTGSAPAGLVWRRVAEERVRRAAASRDRQADHPADHEIDLETDLVRGAGAGPT